ncbi:MULTISPECIES: LysR family transcriptional regulator [unclassified Mesorhizobium]|uniref:LysR family transcriptional regulator n=1 Tax=unclassified Mesorhizobium TaxID=325217 RepID=UPI0003CFA7BF|nr:MULTISPECIES: LysR family transcriptional regulator [unclassified Mesorhizobium]ESZ26376.1 LysR family transcriptional regulator [Mesorhizobium sp. L2C084A000]RUW90994.1 LysR family transcriptional regulator [Mesorhizobium sp. M7A.F.Ca.US.010.02.1.1]
MKHLAIEQLRSFVLVADCESFTTAADLLGTTQSAISLRVRKLEQAMERRLLARTPRAVSLTPEGARFLASARQVLEAHDRAVATFDAGTQTTTLRAAIGDHAAGALLESAFGRLSQVFPELLLEVSVGLSAEMQARYDAGKADFAVVRMDISRRQGIPLYRDQLVWCARSPDVWRSSAALPLLALPGSCTVRLAAERALDGSNTAWRLAFTGGSVTALQSAASAGLGVAAIGQSQVPADCVILNRSHGLPDLPASRITLLTRLSNPLRGAIAAAFATDASDRRRE